MSGAQKHAKALRRQHRKQRRARRQETCLTHVRHAVMIDASAQGALVHDLLEAQGLGALAGHPRRDRQAHR